MLLYAEMTESNDSHEILDKGETREDPGLPLGYIELEGR